MLLVKSVAHLRQPQPFVRLLQFRRMREHTLRLTSLRMHMVKQSVAKRLGGAPSVDCRRFSKLRWAKGWLRGTARTECLVARLQGRRLADESDWRPVGVTVIQSKGR